MVESQKACHFTLPLGFNVIPIKNWLMKINIHMLRGRRGHSCSSIIKFATFLALKIYSKTFFKSIKSFRLFLFPIIEFVLHSNLILLKSNKKFLPALISIHFFAAKWKTFANALDFSLIGFLFFFIFNACDTFTLYLSPTHIS